MWVVQLRKTCPDLIFSNNIFCFVAVSEGVRIMGGSVTVVLSKSLRKYLINTCMRTEHANLIYRYLSLLNDLYC